jgi:uncharacterized protein (TIGR00251 family)
MQQQSSTHPTYAEFGDSGVTLQLYVQPNARVNRIVGMHDRRLKIQLASPPVDGRANAELIVFLAEVFHVGKKNITIVNGQHARQKRVAIQGVEKAHLDSIVSAAMIPKP